MALPALGGEKSDVTESDRRQSKNGGTAAPRLLGSPFPHVFVSLPPQIAVRFKRGVMSEELFAQKGVILSGVPQKQERESTFCRRPSPPLLIFFHSS